MVEEVKLYGMWASPHSQRVELALKLKGIPYQYIEENLSNETWKNNPVLPQDSYERAMVRFWAKFIDEKFLPTACRANFWEGKEREVLVEEISEQIKILEKELNGKDFFGGDSIGIVDIVGSVVALWFQMSQELRDKMLTPENFPGLFKWIGKLREIDVFNECLPPREKSLAYIRDRVEAIKSAPK